MLVGKVDKSLYLRKLMAIKRTQEKSKRMFVDDPVIRKKCNFKCP